MDLIQGNFASAQKDLENAKNPQAVSDALARLSDEEYDKLAPVIKAAKNSGQKTFSFSGFTVPIPDISTQQLIQRRKEMSFKNENLMNSALGVFGDQGAALKQQFANFLGIKLQPKEEGKKKPVENKPAKKEKPPEKTAAAAESVAEKIPTVRPETPSATNQEAEAARKREIEEDEDDSNKGKTLRMAAMAARIATTPAPLAPSAPSKKGGIVRIASAQEQELSEIEKGWDEIAAKQEDETKTLRGMGAAQETPSSPLATQSRTTTLRGVSPTAPAVAPSRTVRGIGPAAVAAGAAAAAVGLGSSTSAATVKTTGQVTTKKSATVTAPAGGGGTQGGEISVTGKREEKIEGQVKTTIEQPAAQAPAEGAGATKVEGTVETTAQAKPGAAAPSAGQGGPIKVEGKVEITVQAKPGAAPAGQAMPSQINIQAKTGVGVPTGGGVAAGIGPVSAEVNVKRQARQGFQHAPPSPGAQKSTVVRPQGQPTLRGMPPTAAQEAPRTLAGMPPAPQGAEQIQAPSAPLPTGMNAPQGLELSPTATPGSVQRMQAPRPSKRVTGGAAPSAIRRPVAKTTGARPGPQISRPLGAAMSLGATQQRARASAPSGGLAGDTKPLDVTGDIMSDKPRAASMQTPGIYSPLEGRGAYSMGARAPGSIATEAEEEDLASKGGIMATDEEGRAQALESAKQRQRSLLANMPGAVPLAAGAVAAGAAMRAPSEEEIPVEEGEEAEEDGELTEQDIIEDEEAEETEVQQQDQVRRAMQIEALQAQQRQQLSIQGAQASIHDSIEGAKKVQKNLQNIWRVVNAVEALDAEFILPLILWFLTANIQLLNKYTFKNKLIPPASLPEDALTCCIDCFAGSMMFMSFFMQLIIVALVVLPYALVGATIVAAGYLIGDWAGLTGKIGEFVSDIITK